MQGKAPGFASETARTVRRGLTTVWELLVVSLPRMLRSCAAMSDAEWRVWGSTSWGHFKEEMVHYWIGFKLLCAEVLIASRLSYQALQVRRPPSLPCLALLVPPQLQDARAVPRTLRAPLVPLPLMSLGRRLLSGFRWLALPRMCVCV